MLELSPLVGELSNKFNVAYPKVNKASIWGCYVSINLKVASLN